MMKLTNTPDQIGADVKPMQSYESLKRLEFTPACTCNEKWQKWNIFLFVIAYLCSEKISDTNKAICPTFFSIAIEQKQLNVFLPI